MAESKHKPGPWTYRRIGNEPSMWMRKPLPFEINGFDPLSGLIIAHSPEECARLDAAASKATGE